MSEKIQQLQAKLAELQRELSAADELDDAAREKLEATLADIHAHLDAPAKKAAKPAESLADRLKEATTDFETSHPTLTQLMGRIADALGQMGI